MWSSSENYNCCLGLNSSFNGISIFVGYLKPKPSLQRTVMDYLTYIWRDKDVHTFSKGICPKVNVIAWLEFKIACYDVAVQHISDYAMRPTWSKVMKKFKILVHFKPLCDFWATLYTQKTCHKYNIWTN